MAKSPIHALLDAVRRRLWRMQFVAAVRLALWISAALMLFAVTVHLAALHVPAGTVVAALGVLWTSLMVRAGWRRPTYSDCALWADRHLGGASAFTTWLEMARYAPETANPQALRWLENWTTARVPDSLGLLVARREPTHLSRALLGMLVCTALAMFVLALPNAASSSRQRTGPSSASAIADRQMPLGQAPAAAELAGDIARALRGAASPDEPRRREAGRASAGGSGTTDNGKVPATVPAGTSPAGARATVGDAPAASAGDGGPSGPMAQTKGTGAGSAAGKSRDDRAEVGLSPPPRGTIPMPRSQPNGRRGLVERQADIDQLATYDEQPSMPGAPVTRADRAAAAATPPPATESRQLSATETTYVQAWMKASTQRR